MIKNDETLFLDKLNDYADTVSEKFYPVYTAFCDPYLTSAGIDELKKRRDVRFCLFGGFDDAERNMFCIHSEFDEIKNCDFPITALKITGRDIKRLSHRDYLGTLMSLGIKREKIGDIVICEGYTVVFVCDNISEYICLNMTKVGGAGITIEQIGTDQTVISEPEFEEKTGTVSSLRLDSVIALAFGLSRSKSVDAISQSRVFINHKLCESASKELKEGDLVTLRGSGRIILDEIGSLSRKGRIFIKLKRYV